MKMLHSYPASAFLAVMDLPHKTYSAMLKNMMSDIRLFKVLNAGHRDGGDDKLGLIVAAADRKEADETAKDLVRLAINWAKTDKGMKKSHATLYRLLTKYSTARATMRTGKSKDVAIRFVGSDNENVFIFKNPTIVEMETLGLVQIDGDTIGLAWERSGCSDNYFYWCRFRQGSWEYNCTKEDKRPHVADGGYASLEAVRKLKNDTSELVLV